MDTATTDTQALPSGTRLEEFVIEKVLGAGGFGITYLARDVSLNRPVVIKENLPAQFAWRETASGTVRPRHTSGGDADDYLWSMNNFLREAEMLASLDHPGIVRVLRKFEANGTAYFVMPFVQGVALDTLIEDRRSKNSPFSEDELRGLLERMLDALAYLHDRGIYHRDIKPGNILISNEGVPALIDFGSARQRLSERSMTVVESAGYTPFEQLQSRGNVGPWSDLYALGATLVKAITFETLPKAADRVMEDPWPGFANDPRFGLYTVSILNSIEQAAAPSLAQRWQDARQWKHYLQTGMTVSQNADMPQAPQPASQAPPQTGGDSEANTIAPALWNPNAATILSFILVPLVGVFLHARNSRALGMPQEERRNMWWFYGLALLLATSMVISGIGWLIKLYIPGFLVWYFTSGRNQEKLVEARFGKNYPRNSFIKPVLIGFGGLFASVIFLEGLHSLAREEPATEIAGEVSSLGSATSATKQNGAVSDYNRGLAYATGDGVAQDLAEAVKWYRKAADQGHAEAQSQLGRAYILGIGVSKDLTEGAKWFSMAAAQGDSSGQNGIGACYQNGFGVNKDAIEAVSWYRKAADQGNAKALRNLGNCYWKGEGVNEDYTEAVKLFRLAAEQNDSGAQNMLGVCYQRGMGVAQDAVEVVKWFRLAAEQGDAYAQNSLGECYKNGEGVTKNDSEAVKWFRKSADQGNAAAQRELGGCYWSGEGVTVDDAEAAKWFGLAAKQGDSIAQAMLGIFHQNGIGMAKNAVEAVKWYQMASEQGHALAQTNLGNCYWKGEGVTKDDVEAVKWFHMAAEQNEAEAQNMLGVCHQYGIGVEKYAVEAVTWYRKAADQGNAVAQRNLGDCYYNGVGVEKDAAYAVKWYRKAAEQNDAWSQNALGDCYQNGDGVIKNLNEAVKWYQKSANQGNNTAQFNLGYLNATGEGVPKDLVLAYMWWNLSAVSGEANAKNNLEKVSKQMTPEQISEAQRLCREWKGKQQE